MTDTIIIYSDGSCSPNPGPGGYAALLIYPDGTEREIVGSARQTTNNQMELTAAVRALTALEAPSTVEFYTDSEYLKKGITEWMKGWVKKGWKTAAGKPVLNRELWEQLHAATLRHKINWQWTKAHVGTERNERVDRLANEARVKRL